MVTGRWRWLAAALWLIASATAAKLEMQQQREGDLLRYHYSWQDSKRRPQQLTFSVPVDGEQGVRYRSYRPEMAAAEVRQALLKTAAGFKGRQRSAFRYFKIRYRINTLTIAAIPVTKVPRV